MAGIDSDLIRGHIDTIILKVLYQGDKYGLEIIQEIEEKSNGTYELKQPTLYSCLKRLETQGLISSYWQDSEIGGKRHYYKLTEKGLETFKDNQDEWLRSREIIDNLIYNTSIEYAPVGGNDSTASIKENEPIDKIEDQPKEEFSLVNTSYDGDFMAEDNQDDEFASFDNIEETAGDSFFVAKSESSEFDLFDMENEEPFSTPIIEEDKEETELISLNIEDNLDEDETPEQSEEIIEDTYSINTTENEIEELNEEPSSIILDNEIYSSQPEPDELTISYNDEIYNPEPEIPEDEQIYIPEEEEEEPQESSSPTYINFGTTNNYEEADITNIEEPEAEPAEILSYSIDAEDNVNSGEISSSIEETANSINEQYYNNQEPIVRASAEEINNLYRTTENYENLQAGYTDEKYKQMLNELEAYSSTDETLNTTCKSVMTIRELTESFDTDGIKVREYKKYVKETNEAKIHIKTNQIHFIKNWITFGVVAVVMMIVFLSMNAFRNTYTYNFGFWQFSIALACALIIPLYSTIKYLINPYKRVVAKFAPRLSLLLSVLITIQLLLVIYCINLQLGFYSFSQDHYNHLLWVLPLILSFIPVIQFAVYLPLYNSKKFHI